MWKGPQRHKSSEKCKSKPQWNILCVEKLGLLSCVSFILTLMTLLTPAAWRSFHTAWFWYTDRAFGSVSQFWHSLPGERVGPMGEGLSPASLPALRVARGRSRATHDVCLVRQQTGICLNEDFKDESEGLGRCKNRLRHLRQALVSLVSQGCYFFHRSACKHPKTNVYWLFIPYQDLVSKHFLQGVEFEFSQRLPTPEVMLSFYSQNEQESRARPQSLYSWSLSGQHDTFPGVKFCHPILLICVVWQLSSHGTVHLFQVFGVPSLSGFLKRPPFMYLWIIHH